MTELELITRDGTSQAARLLDPLQPSYVSVDERSVQDLLFFAREYARLIRYFDPSNQPSGDWTAFVGSSDSDFDLSDAAAFLEEPAAFSPDTSPELFRPHLVLFLAFLRLFQAAQAALNTLSQRHLDFYYQQVLGMARRPAIPDGVNLLLDLAPSTDEVEVPAGSQVSAGPDSLGNELIYATDRDVVVNRAQIAQLSSLCLDQRITGIAEAREAHANDRAGAEMAMLQLALGNPNPGDPLPLYPNGGAGKPVDDNLLAGLRNLLQFAHANLFLQFYDLRSMMELKHRRDGDDADWAQINRVLQKAGQTRAPKFQLPTAKPRDFDGNLLLAVGGALNFAGLPEVKSVYDLYDHRTRSDVVDFIPKNLFMSVDDFVAMMQIKVRIDGEWAEINGILQQAGSTKTPGFQLGATPGFDPTNFAANLQAALSPNFSVVPGIADIEAYYSAILQLESYFFVSAEEVQEFLLVAQKTTPPATAMEWDHADQILEKAYQEKLYAQRRAILKSIREASGFAAMIHYALGDPPGQTGATAPLDRLQPFLGRNSDFAFLQAAEAGPPASQDWNQVYQIVEIAQRNREGLGEPVAQRVEWLNLYPAADATKAVVTSGPQGADDLPRWRTFGMPVQNASVAFPPPSVLGWAINSPLLAMSEGKRTITLTLGFLSEQFDRDKLKGFLAGNPIRFEVSTQKGWVETPAPAPSVGLYGAGGLAGTGPAGLGGIQWTLVFDETTDPFAPPSSGAGSTSAWPVLRLTLRQVWKADTSQYTTPYPPLRDLVLVMVHLKVDVAGIKSLSIANDDTVLDPNKPFLPFGNAPVPGARLYIGHSEIVAKKLDNLTFHVEWMGVPQADLSAYYKNYGQNQPKPGAFTAKIGLMDQRVNRVLVPQSALFSAAATDPCTMSVPNVTSALPTGYNYVRLPGISLGTDLLAWNRYLTWELNAPDFQHQSYPGIAAARAIDFSAAIAKGSFAKDANPADNAANYQVNPPYTPKIKSLQLDYSSSQEIQVGAQPDSPDLIFHVHPFGFGDITAAPVSGGFPFVPRYDNEGELYIGLQGVVPPQNVAILFQAAAGSADPDLTPPEIQWSVLDGDRWMDLDKTRILSDTTRGLINTGILEFDLPAVAPSTLLPGGLYWIRAAAAWNSTGVCDAIALATQAVRATLMDRGNAPDHFGTPLKAGSITKFAPPITGIAGVSQPYTSSGGRMAEQDALFYTRVSERLRHKQRALSPWDYERLILAQFPEVYKVKCIPASLSLNPGNPGTVQIIVIPDIRNKLPFSPFEPKAPADMLADIQTYLADKIPYWATLHVGNAHYVAIKLRLAVRFSATGDENYYTSRLNDDLNRFLSPWAYADGADIVIGGKLYANSIVDFVEGLPYVDYVANVELFQSDDGLQFRQVTPPAPGDVKGYFVQPDRPDGILVAARDHQVDLIPDTGYSLQLMTGIGFMKLELDFVVA